jgi:hypothetical protein
MADICDCGRVIEQPATGRKRRRCKVCRPPQTRKPAPVVGLPSRKASQLPEPAVRRSLAASTRADLAAVGREDTTAGITTLHLAELLDAGGYTAQGAASLVKAHREALGLALEGTASEADVIDLIFGSG